MTLSRPDLSVSWMSFVEHFAGLVRDCVVHPDGGMQDAVVRVFHRVGTAAHFGAVVVALEATEGHGFEFVIDQNAAVAIGHALLQAARSAEDSDRDVGAGDVTGMDFRSTRVRRQ